MSEDGSKTIDEQLDEMALKIMMVEPGDLSVVGELVVLVEGLAGLADIDKFPVVKGMGKMFGEALNKIVMGNLFDTAENYDLLGKCIGLMQECHRKNDDDEEGMKQVTLTLGEMDCEGDTLVVASAVVPEEVVAVPDVEDLSPEKNDPPAVLGVLDEPPESFDFLQDHELLGGFVEETIEHLESIEVNILELEDNPGDLEIINNIFRPFHTIKGVAGFLNLKNIQRLAHTTENLLDDVRNNKRAMDSGVIEVVLKVGDCLKLMVENLREAMDEGEDKFKNYDIAEHVKWVCQVQGGAASGTDPEQGNESVKNESVAPKSVGPQTVTAPPSSSTPSDVDSGKLASPKAAASAPKKVKKRVGASIKVDIDKLDGLVNAVGELVIMQAMVRANPLVAEIADPKLTKDFSQLTRITSELQKTAMSMRMVPIRQTFQKMIRLVRDLSKKSGKTVNLVMEGEETEIDRNMVDSIYDPLVHMMRNSVDHGVQTPKERESLGKPSAGTVSLRAYQKGGYMVIEIEDDGQGLNTEKIKRKALERGLIQEGDNQSAHELNNLVFLPGFSTVDTITDISGRGVGMDVVKKAVEKLRGNVDVLSEPGDGSLFTIRLPLTLAIIDGIIVKVAEERYIIPTTAIRESFKPKRENYNTVKGKGEALMVRDSLVPIIRLYKQFGVVNPMITDPCEGIVVVVESEGKQRAILVDELLGKQEVVIKNLGGLQDIPGVAGGTILGDGRVGLILDLAGLVSAPNNYSLDEEVKVGGESSGGDSSDTLAEEEGAV